VSLFCSPVYAQGAYDRLVGYWAMPMGADYFHVMQVFPAEMGFGAHFRVGTLDDPNIWMEGPLFENSGCVSFDGETCVPYTLSEDGYIWTITFPDRAELWVRSDRSMFDRVMGLAEGNRNGLAVAPANVGGATVANWASIMSFDIYGIRLGMTVSELPTGPFPLPPMYRNNYAPFQTYTMQICPGGRGECASLILTGEADPMARRVLTISLGNELLGDFRTPEAGITVLANKYGEPDAQWRGTVDPDGTVYVAWGIPSSFLEAIRASNLAGQLVTRSTELVGRGVYALMLGRVYTMAPPGTVATNLHAWTDLQLVDTARIVEWEGYARNVAQDATTQRQIDDAERARTTVPNF